MNLRIVLAGACVLLGCTACGFKGPLYLPQQNAAVVTHPASAQAAKVPSNTAHKDEHHNSGGSTATPP